MSDNKALPGPLCPPEVDLRDFEFMPLHVQRLRDSDWVSRAAPEEFRAGVLLWSAAWHQVPAGSLPCDEQALAKLAGYGFAVKSWRSVAAGALHGFVRCADGRMYHPVVVEAARSAWLGKVKRMHATECNRIRAHNARTKSSDKSPTLADFVRDKGFDLLWITHSGSASHAVERAMSRVTSADVTRTDVRNTPQTSSKGQGQGEYSPSPPPSGVAVSAPDVPSPTAVVQPLSAIRPVPASALPPGMQAAAAAVVRGAIGA